MPDFTLQNDEPEPPPRKFNSGDGKQRVLFAGLDCLPGQLDLFKTDGREDEQETSKPECLH